jgi:methyl-accepting chemotaxis protein
MQAASTQQSSAAMAQIHKAAADSGKNSRASVEQTEEILARLRDSRSAVSQLTAGVAEGLAEAQAVLGDVESLEESGRRIEKIVDSIALVAVQTTMLAVSGSVEAARAGELGEGFALVSTDIRSLARDSSENAERIKDLIQAIQGQVNAIRRELDQLTALLENEVEKNATLDGRLAGVEDSALALRSTNEDIARGAEDILATVSEVLAGTQQIAAAAQESGTAAAQAAIAARQQSQGVEELAAAIEEIALLAEELQASGS